MDTFRPWTERSAAGMAAARHSQGYDQQRFQQADCDIMTLPIPHVLLVEDEESHVNAIRKAFKGHTRPMSLSIARSLGETQRLLEVVKPSLILADLSLPDGTGADLTRYVRQDKNARPAYPLVLLPSFGEEDKAIAALAAGALDYVVKSHATLNDLPRIAERALQAWGLLIEREESAAALRASEQRYRALYDDTPAMFFTVNTRGTILSANQFGAEQLGYSCEELVGLPLAALHPEDNLKTVTFLHSCVRDPGRSQQREARMLRRDGTPIWVKEIGRLAPNFSDAPTILIVSEDISEAHELSVQLSYQAAHDPLTGLLNRREFERCLHETLESARREHTTHALFYLDLDQFKVVNDTCGHGAGDELLRQISKLLRQRFRSRDTVARLGGDEFGILVDYCSLAQAERLAEIIRKTLAVFRFEWGDKSFNVGASIGLIPISDASASVSHLLQTADAACYTAKDRGRNRIHVVREDDVELVRRNGEMQWVTRLTKALEEARFKLCYQPISPIGHDADGGLHIELLLRAEDDDGGDVSPEAFLPAAERYNLITQVDRWVVATALRWLKSKPDLLERLSLCAINLSGHSLGDEEFPAFVIRQLHEAGIPPAKICFEITETAAIAHFGNAARFIQTLKALGCRFALDDFGSGVSSFAYLKNLPVDFLKIDGAFVKEIARNPIDFAMVRSINEIGHVMGLKTVAEFVENDAILAKLRDLGVDYAQGFVMGRPLPIDTLV
ncbi:MAG: EAL domain-containing protein [Gammaproteobacteria bacterium]